MAYVLKACSCHPLIHLKWILPMWRLTVNFPQGGVWIFCLHRPCLSARLCIALLQNKEILISTLSFLSWSILFYFCLYLPVSHAFCFVEWMSILEIHHTVSLAYQIHSSTCPLPMPFMQKLETAKKFCLFWSWLIKNNSKLCLKYVLYPAKICSRVMNFEI